jgi:osmotically-inducible protein OsmY
MKPQTLTAPLPALPNILGRSAAQPATTSSDETDRRNNQETRRISDEALVGWIHRAILGTGRGSLQRVIVRANAGHVVMCGRVPTYYFKQLAQQAAMSVPGVERIDNQLVVR